MTVGDTDARRHDAGVVIATGGAASYAGEITDEELERERDGSGLRYSFDIKNGSVTDEVGVDAKTGQVLENSVERGRR